MERGYKQRVLIVLAVLLIFWWLLSGCRTVALENDRGVEVRERVVRVEVPTDSSAVTALFECDSLNRVVLRELDEARSKGAEVVTVFRDGRLQTKTVVERDTVYVSVMDTVKWESSVRTVEVNRLRDWQLVLIWIGAGCLVFFVVWVVLKFKG